MAAMAKLIIFFSLGISVFAVPASLVSRSISQGLMDQFERFVQFASGAYQLFCPAPLGTTLVTQVCLLNLKEDCINYTQYFCSSTMMRQTPRDILLVMMRTSKSLSRIGAVSSSRTSSQVSSTTTYQEVHNSTDYEDLEFALVDFSSSGVAADTAGVQVHQGFITAFNSVADTVTSTVSAQLAAHPSYTLVSVGHSLGAALASLGGVSLASNFPGKPLLVYTFGQPRTGNQAYANMAESLIGVENIFRGESSHYQRFT